MNHVIERSRRRPAWPALLLIALFASVLLLASPAQANETNTNNWQPATNPASLNGIKANGDPLTGNARPLEISGIATGPHGSIYVLDDENNNVYCVANLGSDQSPDWTAQIVEGINLSGDTEGITYAGGDTFYVVREDGGGNDGPSGITEITISGLSGTTGSTNDLIADGLNDSQDAPRSQEEGGAEGIAYRGTPGQFVVVQEGLVTNQVARPTLYTLDYNGATPVLGSPITLAMSTDAAGIAIEPGANSSAFVVSETGNSIHEFLLSNGSEVGDGFATGMLDTEGLAFTDDGFFMIAAAEGSQIRIFKQNTGNAPLPKGNCDGPQDPCPTADVIVSPNPVQIGDQVSVEITLQDCDVDVARTRLKVWNSLVDWDSHTVDTATMPGVSTITTQTFTGTATTAGTLRLQVNAHVRVPKYNEDGSANGTKWAVDVYREDLTVQQVSLPSLTNVEIQSERTGQYLASTNWRTHTTTTVTDLWNFEPAGDGTFYLRNADDGRYLDIAHGFSRALARTAPQLGSKWILRETATASGDQAWYIATADYPTPDNGENPGLRNHATGSQWVTSAGLHPALSQWFIG